jgi:hypothetical protein
MARFLAVLLSVLTAPAKVAPSANPATITCAGPHVCPTCQSGRCDNLSQEWVCDGVVAAGTACDDGHSCTSGDHCDGAGKCVGSPYSCAATDCQLTSNCDGNGGCDGNMHPKSDGASCDDHDPCTGATGTPDHCVSGSCVSGMHTQCNTPGTCQTAVNARCDSTIGSPTSGQCVYPTATDKTPCDDAIACTKNDVCTGGVCGGTAYSCSSPGTCQTGGSCDGSGGCTYTPKVDGAPCNDNPLTTGETCTNGACGNPTGCAAGAVFCNGVCTPLTQGSCCADSDCLVSGNEGHQVCLNHVCTGAPTCAEGFFACGSTCLPNGACCSNADCPFPLSCVNNACSLGCAAGLVACGTSCVQTGAQVCCPSDNN